MSASQIATTVTSLGSMDAEATVDLQVGAPQPPALSLKTRAMFGSAWLMTGYGTSQVLRFASSLILSRLIVPEVTGLMAMVSVFLIGLEMFSDIGIGPGIIQNKKGDDATFLNTAWTMQVGRGFMLWIIACLGAWPVSQFFNEPLLVWLIPIVGFTAVLSGFNSTSIVWLNRHLRMRKIMLLGIGDQVINYTVIIVWAWFSPTVWALVGGAMISNLFYTVATHFLVPGHRNRFCWNAEDARAMFRFGRWIFFSTALTFFAMQADRIMCGRLLGTATLGVYGYAVPLAMLAPQFIKQIGAHVAFPVLSEVARTRPHMLSHYLGRVRMSLIGLSLLVLLPLMLLGSHLIRLLYPEEWWSAGWMLQILAAGALGGIVNSTYGSVLLALGRTFDSMVLLGTHLMFLIGGALLGYHLKGEVGFIVGVAAVEWLNYPATAAAMARLKLWQPAIDLPALLISAAAIAVAFVLE